MRLLYVCPDPSVRPGGRGGGFTTHMEEMIRSFKRLGHDVTVLDSKTGPEPAQGGIEDRTAKRMPRTVRVLLRDVLYLLHNVKFYARLARLLRQDSRFDFMYERCIFYQFATVIAARRWKIPLILEFNASLDEMRLTDGLGLRPLAALIEKHVVSRAGAVVTVSGVLKKYLVGLGVPAERVIVLHNAVDLDRFSPSVSGAAVRRRFLFSPEQVLVGFVGGFSVWHRAHLLIDVAPVVIGMNKSVRFLMVGGREGNPRFEDFRRRVCALGLAEIFHFAGEVPRDKVPDHIAAMDIAVIPWATDYGSPMKTFEYMGMARALVAPRVPALEEVLEHGENAMLVPPGDVKEIATAIADLAGDPLLRRTLGQNARRAVEQKYNWNMNASATLEVAAALMKAKPGRVSNRPGA
ncbi:MAG: glycosyltransferase family 4 protein [Candidatus Eisenbacteria bacterium]